MGLVVALLAVVRAYVLLARIMGAPRYAMRGLFRPRLPDVAVATTVLKQLLWRALPDVAAHLESRGVEPVFFFEWYFTLFVLVLPPEQCAGAWDSFFADGWPAAFRLVLALLRALERDLLASDDLMATVIALKAYANARSSATAGAREVPVAGAPTPARPDDGRGVHSSRLFSLASAGAGAGSDSSGSAGSAGSAGSSSEEPLARRPPRGIVAKARRCFGGLVTPELVERHRKQGLALLRLNEQASRGRPGE